MNHTGKTIGCVGLFLNGQGSVQDCVYPSESCQYHVGKFIVCPIKEGDTFTPRDETGCYSMQMPQKNEES